LCALLSYAEARASNLLTLTAVNSGSKARNLSGARALSAKAVMAIGGFTATCATTDVLARRLPPFYERRFENG
jgi:uncharacterized metal-binding protein